ncbi:MAG: hypothetical protein K9M07_03620 [Simkaniaceae bacterium]|nr:hypothetical protein [Simkaniaceae bacterium]
MNITSQKNDVIAKESAKTLRDRRKLIARFEEIDKQVTDEGLRHAAMRIRERINRLAPLRVPLGNSFEMFDGNQHPKELSERVKKFASGIRLMMPIEDGSDEEVNDA